MLSQYAMNPAKQHYQAVRAIFAYLNATKYAGITYWRCQLRKDLPAQPTPQPITSLDKLANFQPFHDPTIAVGASDSTWAHDRKTRRSLGGLVIMMAGGAIYYRTRLHPTVALSTTESELYTMTDAGKSALYIRSILEELKISQTLPKHILADNRGAILLANSQQPTKCPPMDRGGTNQIY